MATTIVKLTDTEFIEEVQREFLERLRELRERVLRGEIQITRFEATWNPVKQWY